MEWTIPAFAFLAEVGLGTTTVSMQSALDRYVTGTTQLLNRHALLGHWNAAAMGVELTTS